MSSLFFKTKFEDIKYSVIKSLIKNKIPESYDLDYKVVYPDNNKLGKLMTAFANASGGYIIIGISEEEDTNKPAEIVGIEKEEHSTKITQIALSYSQPKIVPYVRTLELDSNLEKVVVVIKIEESIEPIMYYSKNDRDSNKFYIRINDKVEPMDQPTLKKLFLAKPYIENIFRLKRDYQIYQNNLFNFFGGELVDQSRVLLGLQILPFNKNFKIFDFNSKEIEKFLNQIQNSFRLYNPGGKVHNFDNYVRNFIYLGDQYISRYYIPQEGHQQKSELSISNTGIICHSISFSAKSGKDFLEKPEYEYNLEDENGIKWASYLYFRSLPYLFINWLKLVNLVLKASYNGKIIINIRILGYNGITIPIDNYLYLSNTDDLIIEKSIYLSDLEDNEKIKFFVLDILKEVLRYLGFSIERAEKKTLKLKQDVNKYLT